MISGLFTDFYQLTMGQMYFNNKGIGDKRVVFEMFIRSLPEGWKYFIASGIQDAVNKIADIKFLQEDIAFLRSKEMFSEEYLEYLSNFKFKGTIRGVLDGMVVFPNEPIVVVSGNIIECQMVETLLLNTINYQTLICTKARRVVESANGKPVIDFGMRRAQGGSASVIGAKNCYLAGCVATSNVYAGKEYDIPVSGTMAHSYVMSYGELHEDTAFDDFAKTFKKAILLVDTYDIGKGIIKAIDVAKKYYKTEHQVLGIRIDSGNLAHWATFAKELAHSYDLGGFKVFVSNDLNEYKIEELEKCGCIDGYGVGTEMITAKPVSAISGVYKLVEIDGVAVHKESEGKKTIGGEKTLFRGIVNNHYNDFAVTKHAVEELNRIERWLNISYDYVYVGVFMSHKENSTKNVRDRISNTSPLKNVTHEVSYSINGKIINKE